MGEYRIKVPVEGRGVTHHQRSVIGLFLEQGINAARRGWLARLFYGAWSCIKYWLGWVIRRWKAVLTIASLVSIVNDGWDILEKAWKMWRCQ